MEFIGSFLESNCISSSKPELCQNARQSTPPPPRAPTLTSHSPLAVFPPQPHDFSISLKAQSKNKHFKVQLKENLYCIGQRKFNSMEELVEHYKKAPIFTSEQGDKLYLIKALAAS